MSLLEQASLVLIPSGYKEDTVYSVIPSNGSGDMSFTRASDGTRINSDGLVENTPWNLFQQSETFENAAWTKNNISVATGIGTTPEGLPYRILTNTVNGFNSLTQTPPLVVNSFYSVTIVLKKGTAISVGFRVGAGTWGDAKYNFDTDAFVGSGVAFASRRFLGDGWIEIKYQNFEALQTNFRVFISSSTTGNSLDGLIGQTLLVSKMQISIGSTAKPYFPTTDRLNVPRLTYQNGGGGCPSLLLEPQRTNLALYSEQLDNAVHTLIGVTITANNITSPDGTQNADKITETTANSEHIIYDQDSNASGTYTLSAFLKGGAGTIFPVLRLNGASATAYAGCIFNTSTGAVVNTFYNTYSAPITKVENMGNGWYRVSMTTTTTNTNYGMRIAASDSASPSFGSYGAITYNGSTSNYFYAYGAQLELGAYSSSYIPTTSASATRIADACSKTGISSLIGQTEGTLFVDAYITGKSTTTGSLLLATEKVSSGAIIRISYTNADVLTFAVYSGVSFQCIINAGAYNVGDRVKVAGAYKNNDFIMYVNGIQKGIDTSGSVPTTDKININDSIYGDTNGSQINQAILFPTRLTNSELALITTI